VKVIFNSKSETMQLVKHHFLISTFIQIFSQEIDDATLPDNKIIIQTFSDPYLCDIEISISNSCYFKCQQGYWSELCSNY
jgi:hypothetical protein